MYTLQLIDYKGQKTTKDFNSRKQAYVFINTYMFMNNQYQSAQLYDNKYGEIWLSVDYRARDNYKRRV
jgi:hypothetical protein